MSEDTPTSGDESSAKVHVTGLGGGPEATLSKASNTTQLADRRIQTLGLGVKPPYNPDRLASFLELNETHAAAVRKKARYEVGFGFSIVPVDDVDPDDASDEERETAESFWRGRDTRWQTGPQNRSEPTTAAEVLELARQDYHSVGWGCIELLLDAEGECVGLAHVPANTVRVRKPDDNRGVDHDAPDGLEARGYVQKRTGQQRFFGVAGDRFRGRGEDDDREPIFVDKESGDVAVGDASGLDNEPANELIFFRNPSPLEQDYGIPDWVSAIRTIAGDEAAKEYNRDFFSNDTIPRFVVKVTGGQLSEESKNDLRQMLQGLREESHRAVVLEVEKFKEQLDPDEDLEIELEPLGQGVTEEMSFAGFREKNEHEIAKVHEVPPVLIGVTETSNRSNSDAQRYEFATEVIAPEQHKFAERLYQILHQTVLGVEDWTLEFELRGGDQPGENAKVARRKIQAVRGAVPINRALEMIGEDPLPEEHPVDGQTLVADVGSDTQPVGGGQEPTEETRADAAPPPANKEGERDWADVEADLATKDIEQTQFDSTNLDEGLYDFEDQELYLSFEREEGRSSLYAYVNVPPTEWTGLTAASSAGSYHYDSIRLDYPYVEITNFHDRLPEGPAPSPDDVPEDVPNL